MAAPQGSRPLGAGMAPAVRRAAAWAGLAAAVLTGATACVGGPAAEPPDRSAPAALPTGGTPVALAPSSFSTKIDNRYWPMAPGDRWIYDEVDADGVVSRNVVTVTSATKKVAAGIDGRVVRDTLTLNGQIVEDTFDWYAEDA